MVIWSDIHDEWYPGMISEILQFARLSGTDRTRLLALADQLDFNPMEANFIDGLYQVYLDQSVLDHDD